MAEESVVVFLRAQIGEFNAKMREASGEARSFEGKSGGAFQRFGKISTGILLGAGAAAVGFGTLAVKAALQGEQAHARMVTAIKNAGQEEDLYHDKIEQTVAKMAKYGFENDQVEESIAKLTNVTHDAGKAIDLQGLAADIAKGRNIDLAQATDILVKVEAGRVGALGRLGINVKDVTGKTISQEEALKRLSQMYQGQAAASAETFAGKIAALKAQAANFTEQVGNFLIPIILDLANAGVGVIAWLQHANDATGGLIGKFALFTGAAVIVAATIVKLVQGIQALVVWVARSAGAVSGFVETMRIWALLNPALATGLGLVVIAGAALATVLITLGSQHHKVTEEAKNLTDQILLENKSFEVAASGAIVDYITKHADLIDIMNATGVSTDEIAKAVLGDEQAFKETTGALLDYGRAHRDQVVNGKNVLAVTQALIEKITTERDAVAESRKQVDAHKTASEDLATAKKQQAQATADATDKSKEEKAAQDALIATIKKLNDLTIQAAGGQLALENATLKVGDATDDYLTKAKEAIDAKGKDAAANRAEQEAHISLRQAILDSASAAATDAKNKVDLASKSKGVALTLEEEHAKHAAIKRQLDVLEVTYPGLRGEIERYRAELGLIPAKVNTDVGLHLNVTSAGNVGGITIGNVRLFAAGGRLGPGELGVAGERGWELLQGLPGGGARILSHAASVAAVGAGGPGGPGGTTVVLQGVLDGRDAERRVVKLLADYRLRNGRLPWEARTT